jgi:VanZ family protein
MNCPETIIRWGVRPLWLISIVVVGYLSLSPRVEMPCQFSGADKLAHCLAYAWLGGLASFGFLEVRAALAAAFFMIPLGVGLEIAQHYVPNREFSVADMIANSTGVILGIIAARYARKRIRIGTA